MFSSRSKLHGEAVPLASFVDNGAHLRAEIDWLHELIKSEIRIADIRGGEVPFDEFAGLYVSREEIERYLGHPAAGNDGDRCAEEPAIAALRAAVASARKGLDRRAAIAAAEGIELRLERLVRTFALGGIERTALLCSVAVELDARISRLFAYLQNDATTRRPTLALLARLCRQNGADPLDVRAVFGPSSPLFRHRLLDLAGAMPEAPFPTREVRPAAGVVEFLVSIDGLPPPLADAAELVRPSATLDGLGYHRHHRTIVEELLRCRHAEGRVPACYIAGPVGAGISLIVETLAVALGKNLLRVRPALLTKSGVAIDELGAVLGREARTRDCLVHLYRADDALAERGDDKPKANLLDGLLQALAELDVVATGTTPPRELRQRLSTRLLGLELPYPTLGERAQIWQHALPPPVAAALTADIPVLAGKFRFTPGQIGRAVRLAEMAAPRDGDGRPWFGAAELHARCRDEAQHGLQDFCHKIVPHYHWDDIVLPADCRAQLQEICRWVKHRAQVYEAWGFGAKLALGKGLTVLFSGASGTGKTMSAEIIAGDLDLDLYRVDLSRIVSKYIGETEKNLSRIFERGATSNSILFFDEADSLFGKRTEVKDAHDRYANIEINYLLSEMDRYEGIVIVSTNLKGNLDQAFIRRFSHVVEYPMPNEHCREEIWRKSFPAQTPLDNDVDFSFLAQKFNLSGGNIKNITLNSAFLASADGREVGMEHVIRATKREYQKIGRVCSKSDFGQYYALVREAGLP